MPDAAPCSRYAEPVRVHVLGRSICKHLAIVQVTPGLSLVTTHPPSPQAKRSKTLPNQRGRKRLLTVLGTSGGRGKRRHRP